MIEADAGDRAFRDEIEQQRVRGVEHARVFHAQAREIVDVEEAAIVDLVERRAPVRQPIRLDFEQAVQPVERLGTTGLAVERVDRARDVGRN